MATKYSGRKKLMEIVAEKAARKAPEVQGCGVIVGRFQLHELHTAHLQLFETVRNRHRKVIVFLGVSSILNSKRNPLDFLARKQMIEAKFGDVMVCPLPDNRCDEAWSKALDGRIREMHRTGSVVLYGSRDSFMGHYKGSFPTAELEQKIFVSGSEVRARLADEIHASAMFRAGVIWARSNKFDQVYPTVDVAVLKREKREVLLARKPGETGLRFIGGFSDPKDTSYEHSARREVFEETGGIEISDPVYVGSLRVDDWRYRSESDKIITMLFVAEHVYGTPKPSDDISELSWENIDKLVPERDLVPEHVRLFELLKARLDKAL